jgi:hypothetical protein
MEGHLQIPGRTGWNPPPSLLCVSRGKSLGVGVDSNHLDIRVNTLDQCRQRAGTTADIENAITGLKGRMIKQDHPGLVTAEQFHNRVIER